MTLATAPRTTDRIREQLAFLLGAFDQLGIEPAHVTAGIYLTGQVSGYQRTEAAIAEVDAMAELLDLAADDGESVNYDRRGPVVIAGRRVNVGIYTGRPQQDVTIPQTPGTGVEGEAPAGPGPHWFDAAMRLPGATLDNVSDGTVDYDGPRCPDCGMPVPDDGRPLCDSCDEPDEEPHPYPCPTCGGNGCRACGDTGERIEWTR